MTQMHAPEIFQSTIVLSDSRKDLLATAMRDALQTLEKTERMTWASLVETPDQQRANARAQRLAWFVESL
jgi:hypothetical protein